MIDKIYDVIVVGGGPAGAACGIYTSRARLDVLIIAKENDGSLLKAHMIDNYPGFPDGIKGNELNDLMKKQAIRFGAQFTYGTVLDFDLSSDTKVVKTSSGNYRSKYVVIASGTANAASKINGEQRFIGSGVSYCATCDGAFTKGLNVTLFGQGDEVGEEALFLTKFAKNIKIFVKDDRLKCKDEILTALRSNNVEIITNAELEEVSGSEYVEKVKVNENGALKEYPCDFTFLYLGTKSNTELFGGFFKLDKQGYIITDENMSTGVQNVYAVGDIRSKSVRQVTTAVNDGTIAALEVIKERLKNTDK